MNERSSASWVVFALGALCVAAIVVAVLVVGPPTDSSAAAGNRTAKVARGVVQSTVSGSGNVQSASQLNLGFKAAGTVTHIYVKQGEQVAEGQLLATLDPQSAEVTLEQSKASLQSAEANLAKEEETDGEGSTQSSGGSSGGGSTADVAYVASTSTAPTTTSTSPSSGEPANTQSGSGSESTKTSNTSGKTNTTKSSNASEGKSSSQSTSGETHEATISEATREANLASARAAVRSAELTVQSDEQAVQNTKLYAPQNGTIVSLSGQVGEVVSGGGTTRDSSSSSSSGSSGSSGAGASGGSSSSGSSSSGSGSSSSTSFAVLSDLSAMELVVPLNESEVGSVRAGQIATVTVEALEGDKLGAHVSEVSALSTSNSGVVSYDVTFRLDQLDSGLKPGMSATAEVVIKQAEGLNVPTSAITASTVKVVEHGKQVARRVVTGLRGNSSTIIVSGLTEGETVALPSASTTGSSATSGSTSRFGSKGAGGLSGGGFAGGASAFPAGGGGPP